MCKYKVTMDVRFKKTYLIDADDQGEATQKGHQAIEALAENLPVVEVEKRASHVDKYQDNGTGTAGSPFANLPCEWLPIELAPKDGTEILLRAKLSAKDNPFGTSEYTTGVYQDWWEASENDWYMWPLDFKPTHFMPIPPISID